VRVSPLSDAVTESVTGPMPLTAETWLLNRVVATLIEAWSVDASIAGVTAASEAESAMVSSVAFRVEDCV